MSETETREPGCTCIEVDRGSADRAALWEAVGTCPVHAGDTRWLTGLARLIDSDRYALYVEAKATDAELSRLRGVVEAVQALADEWECRPEIQVTRGSSAERLRAALAPVSSSGESHVEIGGQVLTEPQFAAARRPLLDGVASAAGADRLREVWGRSDWDGSEDSMRSSSGEVGENDRLRAEVAALRSALVAIRSFHGNSVDPDECMTCESERMPCRTARAADAALSSGEAERPRRYDQCDGTCTVDCGHCKGQGRLSGEANGDDHERGLYGKYRVERIGDPTGKHADCRYFVLDAQHDPNALPALRTYADACEDEYPALAADLREWAGPAPVPSGGQADGEGRPDVPIAYRLGALADWCDSQRTSPTTADLRALAALAASTSARPVLSREAESGEAADAVHAFGPDGRCPVCGPLPSPAPVPSEGQANGGPVACDAYLIKAAELLVDPADVAAVSPNVVAAFARDVRAVLAARPVLSREALRERLDGHWPFSDNYGVGCGCGWYDNGKRSLWRDHLADVLAGGEQP